MTLNATPTLARLIRHRQKEAGYDSIPSYLCGLVVFDLMSRRIHRITRQLMDQPARVRDAFFEDLAAKYDAGIRMDDSGWADKIFAKLVDEEIALREREKAEKKAQRAAARPKRVPAPAKRKATRRRKD